MRTAKARAALRRNAKRRAIENRRARRLARQSHLKTSRAIERERDEAHPLKRLRLFVGLQGQIFARELLVTPALLSRIEHLLIRATSPVALRALDLYRRELFQLGINAEDILRGFVSRTHHTAHASEVSKHERANVSRAK